MDATAPGESATDAMTAPRRTGRNLPAAIATGVALAVAVLGSLLWHPLAFLTLVFALVVVALLELDSAFADHAVRPATPVVIGAGAIALYGAYFVGSGAQAFALALLLLGAAVWAFLSAAQERVVDVVGRTLFVGVWVPFCASFAALLIARPHGLWYVVAAVALTVATDVGAYGFGSTLGRHKLAPRVSPGKTWEGFAGGLFTVLVLATLVIAQLPGFDLRAALLVGVAVSVAGTLGDLTESLVKRDLGLKDLGRLLPGHGGIMDRVDSIIFALPAAHFVLIAVGL